MIPPSSRDSSEDAKHAWRRYRHLMAWMFGFTMVVLILALSLFYAEFGMISIHFYIATTLGIVVAMLLMSALMGLVFLSSGSGHDESIIDPLKDTEDE